MKIATKTLKEKFNRITSIVPKGGLTLPILSNCLVTAEQDKLTLAATNLVVSYITSIVANTNTTARCMLPAHKLARIIKELPGDELELTIADAYATIRADGSTFKLAAGAADDYPAIEGCSNDKHLATVNLGVLKDGISKVAFAAGDEYSRMDRIELRLSGQTIRLTATDGYRAAVCSIPTTQTFTEQATVILPAEIETITKAIEGEPDTPISICGDGRKITLYTPEETIIVNTLDSSFPNVDDIVAAAAESVIAEAHLPATELIQTLKRVMTITDESPAAELTFTPDTLYVRAESEKGSASDQIDNIRYDGDEHTTHLNGHYVIQFLRLAAGDIQIHLPPDPSSTHMFKPDSNEDYTYILMPVVIG
jgi:DNA polymerase-3 subunit beta